LPESTKHTSTQQIQKPENAKVKIFFFVFSKFPLLTQTPLHATMASMTTWTKPRIALAIKNFIETTGHEPRNDDFINHPELPHPRLIQRHHGGLKALRIELGLNTVSFTTKKTQAIAINKNASEMEALIYNQLYRKYHTGFSVEPTKIIDVSRQFAYQQWRPEENYYSNTSVDIAISFRGKRHHVLIDLFHPTKIATMQGCVNIKRKKVESNPVFLENKATHELFFVCTNPSITQEEVDKHLIPHKQYKVLAFSTFQRDILSSNG
jgi:hypothetical protein